VTTESGLAWKDDRPNNSAKALATLEKRLRKWYKEQGIDLKGGLL
jgi:hypothetical protein